MLNHDQIAAMIPHSGAMCLLDRVIGWDAQSIRCVATSHRDKDNPLSLAGVLGIVCGVEYAAQAMAVHGGLTGNAEAAPKLGYLASLRALICHVHRLDDLTDDLTIDATQLAEENGRVLYQFSLTCAGQLLLEGRAAVVLDGVAS